MKQTQLTQAIKETIDLKQRAIDVLVKDVIEPLTDIGSPEALIAKPYEQWLPQDLMALTKIYGTGEDTVLANLIFKREYNRVTKLASEEGG